MTRFDLGGLGAASREALMAEWRKVVGRPPPKHLSRPLMVQILSHAYQQSQGLGFVRQGKFTKGVYRNAAQYTRKKFDILAK